MPSHDNDSIKTYQLPESYNDHAHHTIGNHRGRTDQSYENNERFTAFNFNYERPAYNVARPLHNYKAAKIDLSSVAADGDATPPPKETLEGNLYFPQAFKEGGGDIPSKPTELEDGYEQINLRPLIEKMTGNEHFILKLEASADESGHGQHYTNGQYLGHSKNDVLSNSRLSQAKTLLFKEARSYYQEQGKTPDEAQALAMGLMDRVKRNVKEHSHGDTKAVQEANANNNQEDRSVEFSLVHSDKTQFDMMLNDLKGGHKHDNHTHYVMAHVGTDNEQRNIFYSPGSHEDAAEPGHQRLADEQVHFVIKIDDDRKLDGDHEFTIRHLVDDNLLADNTIFLIENDDPNAVTSEYNAETNQIDIKINGQVAMHINSGKFDEETATFNRDIDPSRLQIGTVTTNGTVTIKPLDNLDEPEVEAIINLRSDGVNNVLTDAAEQLVQLSCSAKHAFIDNNKTQYLAALDEMGFEEQLSEIMQPLNEKGIETESFEALMIAKFTDHRSAAYSPDEIMFPFQTYELLATSEMLETGAGYDAAYDALKTQIDNYVNTDEPFVLNMDNQNTEPSLNAPTR